jgi:8-oxo-dGTP pyrophosphatase MutT (NUDIX family)
MNFNWAIKQIKSVLSESKPLQLQIPGFMPAAVILPLFNKNDEPHILFTVRTDKVLHHKGQVSLPGGAWEAEDASLAQTALRETYEEVGIPPEDIEIIGQLDDFPTISDFLVTPFVGIIPYPFKQRINPDEVAELLEVPLSLFLTDAYFEMKTRKFGDKVYPIYYYKFNDAVIWGVTGYILNRFIEQVFAYNPAGKRMHQTRDNFAYLQDKIKGSDKK